MHPTLLDTIQQRYACREFAADQPVSADALALLLQAGRLRTGVMAIPPGETPALAIALGHCTCAAPERLRKPMDESGRLAIP